MGIIEDVGRMQEEGRNDSEIRNSLRARGISDQEIDGVMSQVLIKGVVNQNYEMPDQGYGLTPVPGRGMAGQSYEPGQGIDSQVAGQSYEGMEPSLMEQGYDMGAEQQGQQSASDIYGAGYGGQYGYQPYQEAISSDVITEVAEQVVVDKLSALNSKIEQAIELGNVSDARLKNFEERIERIEKIFDKLQLSILQRVAEYVDDVKILKTELQETQKSFKSIVSKKGMN